MTQKEYESRQVKEYRDGVWDFILEHCDVLDSGTIFVKFHMSHRKDFEKRVKARLMGYHREDVKKKKFKTETLKQEFMDKKLKKHQAYLERKRKFKKIEKSNSLMKWYYKLIWGM